MAGISLSDKLEIIIGGTAAGFLTELGKASTATKNFITLEQQQAIQEQKLITLAADRAKAQATVNLRAAQGTPAGVKGGQLQLDAAEASKVAALEGAKLNLVQRDVALSAAQAEQAAGKLATGTNALGVGMDRAKTALSGIAAAAPAAVAALGVDLVYKGVQAYTQLGAEVRQVQGVLGGSAEQASLVVGQFNALGINANAVDKSFNSLAISIQSGKDKLNEYGVQVATAKDGSVDLYGTLDNIRHVYQATTDATERDTIANQLKVRGLQNLIPYLQATDAQMKQINADTIASGRVLDNSQLTQSKELSIAMKDAGQAVKGLEINLAQGLAPVLTSGLKLFQDLTSGLKDNRAEQAILAGIITGIVVPAMLKLFASMAGPLIGAIAQAGGAALTFGKNLIGMGDAAAAAGTQVTVAATEVEGAGLTMASAAGPIGLIVGAVVGLGIAFRSSGADGKAFVAALNQGFSSSTTSGLQGQIDADSKALDDWRKKLAAAKANEAHHGSIVDEIFGKIEGNTTTYGVLQEAQAKVDALTKSLAGNKEALANVNTVAKDMKATVPEVFAAAAAASIPLTGSVAALETKLKAAGFAAGSAGTSISTFGVDVAAVNEKLVTSVANYANAEKGLASANKSVESATLSETKAHQAYISLLPGGIAYTKALTAAKKENALASRDLEKAQDAEKKAIDGLNKARQGATALDLAEANLKIGLSADATEKAKEGVRTAQEKLNALQGSGAASQDELIAAQNDVTAALDQVTQAQINQGKEAVNLQTVKQKGTNADPAVIAAQEAVANAHDATTAAQERQQTAADNLAAAQVGDAEKIANALDAWKLAQEGIGTAQEGVLSATFNLHEKTNDLADAYGALGVNLATVRSELGQISPDMLKILALYEAVTTQNAGYSTLTGRAPGSGAGQTQTQTSPPPAAPISTPRPTARAAGGPVEPGGTYLVGEHGPEKLKLGNQFGTVIPNGAGGGSATTIHSTINATTGASAADIAREQAWMLLTLPPPRRSANNN